MATSERAAPKDRPPLFLEGGIKFLEGGIKSVGVAFARNGRTNPVLASEAPPALRVIELSHM